MEQLSNAFSYTQKELEVLGKHYRYFSLNELKDARLEKLPYSVRVLLEAAIRNCDNFNVKRKKTKTNLF